MANYLSKAIERYCFFCPYAQMDLHFSERVIPYVCVSLVFQRCSLDSLLKNNAFQSDVSRQLRTSSPWLWTASIAGRNDYLNKKLLMFSSVANIMDKDIPSVLFSPPLDMAILPTYIVLCITNYIDTLAQVFLYLKLLRIKKKKPTIYLRQVLFAAVLKNKGSNK